jgi:fibronectin type 3 domain-containing protein
MKRKNYFFTILFVAGFWLASCPAGTGGIGSGDGGGLAAPSTVNAVGTSPTSITITWTAVTGAAKYKIYYSVTSTGTYRYVDETELRTYTDSGLLPSTTRYYKVSSVDVNGIEGPQSTHAVGTTFGQAVPVPSSVTASAVSTNSIQVNWNAVTGAMNYRVFRSTSVNSGYTLVSSPTTTSFADMGLTSLTTYFYRVSAVTSLGVSEQSSPVSATTLAASAVPAPDGVQANALSNSSIQISWNNVSGATGYRVFRSNSAGSGFSFIGSASSSPYTDTGLNSSTTYHYRVSTVLGADESEQSTAVSATTSAQPAIQPPSGLSASALSTSSIQVSWANVSDATGYRIFRSNSADGSYSFIGSASSSPYTDNGLSANTTYFYRVSSVRDSQESAQSSSFASATTMGGGGTIQNPPTQPTGLVVTSVSSGSISLSWNAVATADTYNIYRSSTQTGAAARVGVVTGTTFTNTVPANDFYFYQVAGENSSGESPRSLQAFAFAVNHFELPNFNNVFTRSINGADRQYFRLAVIQGQSYTIAWQNGIGGNTDLNIMVSAWQNNGTPIFTNARNDGFTNPRVFTASGTGFVTIEVRNGHSTTSFNYQIYSIF